MHIMDFMQITYVAYSSLPETRHLGTRYFQLSQVLQLQQASDHHRQ